jgi:SAM-dependent methyltransferase
MNLIRALRQRIHANNVAQFMRRISEENIAFDARFNTDTADEVPLDKYDLDVSSELDHGTWYYQGAHEEVLRSIIEALVPTPEKYEFLDIGSGKGKALLVASTYPFKRVRGLEFSPQLHNIAVENLASFKQSDLVQCEDVASERQDARDLADLGSNVFIFMFNPLSTEPMRDFIRRLEGQASAKNSSIMIAYLAPRAREPLDRSAMLQCLLETHRLLVFGSDGVTLPEGASPALSGRFNSWKL